MSADGWVVSTIDPRKNIFVSGDDLLAVVSPLAFDEYRLTTFSRFNNFLPNGGWSTSYPSIQQAKDAFATAYALWRLSK